MEIRYTFHVYSEIASKADHDDNETFRHIPYILEYHKLKESLLPNISKICYEDVKFVIITQIRIPKL